jgi:hypothetical protein
VAAGRLERLARALLGRVEAAVDHVVAALLGQRRRGAVGIARRAVERERLPGERTARSHAAARSQAPACISSAFSDQDRVADARRRGHGSGADGGRVRGGDEHRPGPSRASAAAPAGKRASLELIDDASGSSIELEGNRLPVSHSKDVIEALAA